MGKFLRGRSDLVTRRAARLLAKAVFCTCLCRKVLHFIILLAISQPVRKKQTTKLPKWQNPDRALQYQSSQTIDTMFCRQKKRLSKPHQSEESDTKKHIERVTKQTSPTHCSQTPTIGRGSQLISNSIFASPHTCSRPSCVLRLRWRSIFRNFRHVCPRTRWQCSAPMDVSVVHNGGTSKGKNGRFGSCVTFCFVLPRFCLTLESSRDRRLRQSLKHDQVTREDARCCRSSPLMLNVAHVLTPRPRPKRLPRPPRPRLL